MAVSVVLTPVAIVLELVIFVMALYAGFALKKNWGWLFAVTFLIFGLFDLLGSFDISADILSVLNIIAVVAAVAGMYLLIRENCPCCMS